LTTGSFVWDEVVKTARRVQNFMKKFTDNVSVLDWREEIASDSQNDK